MSAIYDLSDMFYTSDILFLEVVAMATHFLCCHPIQ